MVNLVRITVILLLVPYFLFEKCVGNLTDLLVGVMKPQIADGNRMVASVYGEIIYRAWKDGSSSEDYQNKIEDALQGLVHEAIHAGEKKYFMSLRTLLSAFHDAKKQKGVDAMLLRVYGPILWRSLKCANASVRLQATTLFFDAFPFQDPSNNAAEADSILQKQFDFFTSLLKDTDHRVRASAVTGVCHVVRQYWEALPVQTTRQILTYIVGTLGSDASSASVRYAVVCGLGDVFEQPLARSCLRGLLPLMANAIHDTSDKVRQALIDVLIQVKSVRGIHFYDIVSVENLLARLAEDRKRPAICKAMTTLLLNSFYPQGKESSGLEQTQRCLTFVKDNLPAAEAFYGALASVTSVGSASKLCIMLFSWISQQCASVSLHSEASVKPPADKKKRSRPSDEQVSEDTVYIDAVWVLPNSPSSLNIIC
jgi:condensin-2 complex subunit G2